MIKSKAIQLLKSFSEEEFRSLGRFIDSPFHNNNKSLIRLYAYLRNYFPLFESRNFNKEDLFVKLFPNKSFKDEKIRELMSDLLKIEQNFLRITAYLKKPFDADIFLLNELNIREMDQLFRAALDSASKNTEGKSKLDEDVYKHLIDIYEQKINYNLIRGKIETVFEDVVEKRENIVTYFLIRLFKTTQDMIQIEKTPKDRNKKTLAEKLINSVDFKSLFDYLRDSNEKAHKILEMYYYMMMIYLTKDDIHYYRFKSLIEENIGNLTAGEIYDLLVSLNNCSQCLINSGKPEFLKEGLYAYKFMLSKGVYKAEGSPYLSGFDFRNIVGAGAQQKDLNWTYRFIEEYKDKLEPLQRDNLVNYSKALLSYYRNDYEFSLACLSSVKDSNIVLKIDVRTLLMRIYYDLNSYEEFLSLAEAFRQMIKKSNILDDKRKLHILNFIKSASSLFKIKFDKNKESLVLIKKEIYESDKVSIKFWLLEKMEELERIL